MFSLLATLVLAATTVVQAQVIPPDCTRTAYVALGNTCNDVSAKYNSSTYQFAFVNPDINPTCTNMYSGVRCLGRAGQDCTETYVVQVYDTCDSVAAKYNIPKSTLQANNPNLGEACNNIYPKQVLCVSSTIYHYTP